MNNINKDVEIIPCQLSQVKKRYLWFISTLLLSLVVLATTIANSDVMASGPDLHRLWHKKCATCHGHSADFSRAFLKVIDGELQGRLHVNNFRLFLHNHYLAGKEVDSIYAMLLAEASTKPRFKQECSTCHKTAVEFVRESITIRDGILYSSKLETPVRDYLVSHRDLKEEDVEFFMKQLSRLAHEVYRP